MSSLGEDFKAFWEKHNPNDDDNVKFILSSLVENKKQAQKLYLRYYYLILILTGVFFSLDAKITSNQKSFEVFSIEITNVPVVQWLICPIICFLFYQGVTTFLLERSYSKGIEEFIDKYVKEFTALSLRELINSPSFLEYEFHKMIKYKNKNSEHFAKLVVLALIFIPFIGIVYMVYRSALLWTNISSGFFKILITILTLLLILRVILLIFSEGEEP